MKLQILTNCPEFQNDIGDVVRLFYGEGAALGTESDPVLRHVHEEARGMWQETVTLRVQDSFFTETFTEPVRMEPVQAKRYKKRLIKRCCFAVLQAATGRQMPWGALTGVRPARLFRQQLEEGMTPEAAETLFRDGFRVSESRIALIREILETQDSLAPVSQDVYDVYIGIPFCTTRCSYCSFSSGVIGDGKRVQPYLNALMHEIQETAALVEAHHLSLGCAYIGGGTPTSLSAAQLDRLCEAVQSAFGAFSEWTVEAGRPDTLSREKLRVLRNYPVTRVSINPQTMNDETLRVIGRAHTAEDIRTAFHAAREEGFTDINMDIITALPGETLPMFCHTLDEVEALHPESMTVHTLAIKHSSKLHEMQYEQKMETEYLQMADMARERAHALGMRAYYLYRQKYMASNLENVGFAMPGKICRYNIDNMEETTHVLALGAGAISKRIMGKDKRILRAPNVSNIDVYIDRVDEMIARKEKMITEQL